MKTLLLFLSVTLILLDVYLLLILPHEIISGILFSAIGGFSIALFAYAVQTNENKEKKK